MSDTVEQIFGLAGAIVTGYLLGRTFAVLLARDIHKSFYEDLGRPAPTASLLPWRKARPLSRSSPRPQLR